MQGACQDAQSRFHRAPHRHDTPVAGWGWKRSLASEGQKRQHRGGCHALANGHGAPGRAAATAAPTPTLSPTTTPVQVNVVRHPGLGDVGVEQRVHEGVGAAKHTCNDSGATGISEEQWPLRTQSQLLHYTIPEPLVMPTPDHVPVDEPDRGRRCRRYAVIDVKRQVAVCHGCFACVSMHEGGCGMTGRDEPFATLTAVPMATPRG